MGYSPVTKVPHPYTAYAFERHVAAYCGRLPLDK